VRRRRFSPPCVVIVVVSDEDVRGSDVNPSWTNVQLGLVGKGEHGRALGPGDSAYHMRLKIIPTTQIRLPTHEPTLNTVVSVGGLSP